MKKKIKKIIKNIDNNYYLILLITLILVMPLISTNIATGHDFYYHLANIDTIKNDLLNLNFSHISSFIANNFGYGGAIFYPKLPHIFTALIAIPLNLIGINSAAYAIKISQILIVLLSGIFMYKLLNIIFKNKNVSLLGSIFYITMPYFMASIYVRSSFNEMFIFLFMPIILLSIMYLFQKDKNKFYILFILGYLGLMNSHLVLSVYFTILIFIFLLINIKTVLNKEIIFPLLKAALLVLIFELPLVIQMIEHMNLDMYLVFDSTIMGSEVNNIVTNGLSIKDYILATPNGGNGMYKFINITVIIFSLIGTIKFIFKEKNNKLKKILIGILIFSLISIFLSSKYFPYKIFPSIMLSIQFAFRNLCFVSFGISILAAYGLTIFNNEYKKIILTITILISTIIILPFINQTTFHNISSLTYDTYNGMGFQKEYLTKYTNSNIEYLINRSNDVIVMNEASPKINIKKDNHPILKFEIDNIEKTTTLELPRLYYLGYKITLIKDDNTKQNLDYSYSENGFITINLKESGTILVKYTGTTLYKITILISLFTTLLLLGLYIHNKFFAN